jgi:hypothetical protein
VQAIIKNKGIGAPSLQQRRMTTTLSDFEYSQSTDVRDKVFALLSLLQENFRIPVDYDIPPQRLFFDTLRKAAENECWFVTVHDHVQFALSLQRGLKVSQYQKNVVMAFVVNEHKRQRELALSNRFSAFKPAASPKRPEDKVRHTAKVIKSSRSPSQHADKRISRVRPTTSLPMCSYPRYLGTLDPGGPAKAPG